MDKNLVLDALNGAQLAIDTLILGDSPDLPADAGSNEKIAGVAMRLLRVMNMSNDDIYEAANELDCQAHSALFYLKQYSSR